MVATGGSGRTTQAVSGRSLAQQLALRRQDLELVGIAHRHVRREDLPHAAFAAQPHHVTPAVPVVEVADHRHAARIRRPDREGHALDAVHLAQVRAQALPGPQVRALGQQPDVGVAEHEGKAVGVVDARDVRAPVDLERVAHARLGRGHQASEDVGALVPLERGQRPAGARMQHRHALRAGQQRTHHQAARGLVRAEHAEGVAVLGAHQRMDFGFGQLRRGHGVSR
jgi:hypothetical protein